MMSFGWRPNQSCYTQAQQVTPPAQCAVPVWFWLALGAAAIAGMSKKGNR